MTELRTSETHPLADAVAAVRRITDKEFKGYRKVISDWLKRREKARAK